MLQREDGTSVMQSRPATMLLQYSRSEVASGMIAAIPTIAMGVMTGRRCSKDWRLFRGVSLPAGSRFHSHL